MRTDDSNGVCSGWHYCYDACHPLEPGVCPPTMVCEYVSDHAYGCVGDWSGDAGAYGDPCANLGACDPGLTCVPVPGAVGHRGCDVSGCCTVFCDRTDDLFVCPGAGEECRADLPYPPPGYENVGICVNPAAF